MWLHWIHWNSLMCCRLRLGGNTWGALSFWARSTYTNLGGPNPTSEHPKQFPAGWTPWAKRSHPLSWMWNIGFKYRYAESKHPLKGWQLQYVCVCLSLKRKWLETTRLQWPAFFFFFEKPTNKILFCGLTTETGPKYIKIFYPIICFDQLTTILKIQSWSSWQVQLPNFI